jgi:hypothetical protein
MENNEVTNKKRNILIYKNNRVRERETSGKERTNINE